MTVWLVLMGMGLVTFALRLALVLLVGRMELPQSLRRLLRFVPPAVLGAIIFMAVLMPAPDGVLLLSPLANVQIIAAGMAVLVAWRTKKILPTILVGIVSFWILQAALG